MSNVDEKGLLTGTSKRHTVSKGFTIIMMGLAFSMVFFGSAWLILVMPRFAEFSGQTSLLKFSSYLELKNFLNNSAPIWRYYYEGLRGGFFPSVFANTQVKDVTADYSMTNIQVEGVDEADIVKCDGEYIYLSTNGKVLIVKAIPADQANVAAEIKLNGTVAGIFINVNRLVIFEAQFPVFSIQQPEKMPFYGDMATNIKVYNVTDKENPVLVRNVTSSGAYFASRMIGSYVYVVLNHPAFLREGEPTLPVVVSDGKTEEIPATSIYYSNTTDYGYEFTTIIALNVQDDNEKPVHETFLLGASRGIYVSLNNIYLVIPRYDADSGQEMTEIHRFSIEGGIIKGEASGYVSGRILNQFSMDEYEENFRIATTAGQVSRITGQSTSSNNVYALNMNLTVIGRLEDLAPGEMIYSARFMGKRCYLVTFKKVDPLFVIGLDDPANPQVLGKLKIPGYSNYLHPYDENLLIGIGKEALDAEEGDFAWYQGVKISLFDASDVEHPKEIAKYVVGDRGTDSPILSDHKALLFDKNRNLLAIPVLIAKIDETKYPEGVPSNAYGDYVWQGLYVFSITADSITLRGGITHIESDTDLLKSGYYFWSEYSVKRSLYIGNLLYSISDKKIKINDLTTLQPVNEVKLP